MTVSASSAPQTETTRYDIPAFVIEIEQFIATGATQPEVAAEVERCLKRLLLTPDLLSPEQRVSLPDRYCPNLITVAPSGAFSVVALVWRPGQQTAIHDHICWCIVGVLEGLERETRYHLRGNDAGERWLAPAEEEFMAPGVTGILLPPDENIHRVCNAGEDVAISLHIYGADLERVTSYSSINECFDHLPIRDDHSGNAIPWRAVDDPECAKPYAARNL
ncbi:MAG: cysteine dioxygenase family protein [Ktedonobacterales bacterium]|nr:cysteine dioxygenase family protein [Ktedonobacterales bacterium]